MTFNVCGLTKAKKRIKVKCFMQDLKQPLDILVGHEHKIHRDNLGWLLGIWPLAEILTIPAIDGRPARRNRHVLAGKGGVFLAIGPRLKASITWRNSTPNLDVPFGYMQVTTLLLGNWESQMCMHLTSPSVKEVTFGINQRTSSIVSGTGQLRETSIMQKCCRTKKGALDGSWADQNLGPEGA